MIQPVHANRDPFNFDDFVFCVCPALNFRQRNELDHLNSVTDDKEAVHSPDEERARKLLNDRVEAEAKNNQEILNEMERGANSEPIKYEICSFFCCCFGP